MKGFNRWLNSTVDIDTGYSSCFKKFAYPTVDMAEDALSKRQREVSYSLRYYQCNICNKFHLTKTSYVPSAASQVVVPAAPKEGIKELKEKYFNVVVLIRKATENLELNKAQELKESRKLIVKELRKLGCRDFR